jgi:ribonuclease G
MASEIFINVTAGETRVALVENGLIVELYVERERDKSIVGNIYNGRVLRVLPGMQAAFVDIGLEKAAFLYVSDIYEEMDDYDVAGAKPDDDEDEAPRRRSGPGGPPRIQDLLREGQEVLVQVAKEPIGTKGARITSHVSLPGRNLVFMPYMDHVGVSRRIDNDKERKRLREIVLKAKPPGCGFIVRTASGGTTAEELQADMAYLVKLWETIREEKEKIPPPGLVHAELPLTLRAVRDLYTAEVSRLVIDDEKQYATICEFIRTFMPATKHNVERHEKPEPIFDFYGIEVEIDEALRRKVWLKSGGYIIVEQTEALTAIDVNTGRYVGKRSLEDTILKTNLEAVKEVVYQLRFRNIGGIIIIDFIDMERESNRDKVFSAFREALRYDKAKTNILKISELGLVEMTRKRTRENLIQILCEPCSYCEGRGYLKSKVSICYKIFREVKREAVNFRGQKIIVHTHPEVAEMLYEEENAGVEELERAINKTIIIRAKASLHQESFEIQGI